MVAARTPDYFVVGGEIDKFRTSHVIAELTHEMEHTRRKTDAAYRLAEDTRMFMDFCVRYHPMIFADWKRYCETERRLTGSALPPTT